MSEIRSSTENFAGKRTICKTAILRRRILQIILKWV
jgi:hypothetical protein